MAEKITDSKKNEILAKNGVTFLQRIDTACLFLEQLVAANVITAHQSENIRAMEIPVKMRQELLDHLRAEKVGVFIDFCIVLCDKNNKEDLVEEEFGLKIADLRRQKGIAGAAADCPPPHLKRPTKDYEDPPPPCHPKSAAKSRKCHYYKRIETEEMIQISNDLLPGVLQHCGSYNQSLMKASLFGYKRNKPIDLKRIYVCQNSSCEKNHREKVPVSKKDLFMLLFGDRFPKCLSLEGPAGTGKSSYLEEYAQDWSQDVTSCEQRGPDVPCEGHRWKLVVYIAAGGIRGTAANAVRDNLKCKPSLKDQVMHDIDEDGEGVLIMYDAMDELRRQESIDSISGHVDKAQNMVETPRMLVSARDGLLSVKRRYFDQKLHLEGFSLCQGVEYMETYFKEMYSLEEHPVLEYVKANQKDYEWVLSNPLRVHIFSELTACGFLTLQDVKTLTTVRLFRSLDQLLLERDKECRPTQSHQPPSFYQSCLRCLLTDRRTLSQQDVGTDSPYLSLLQRHDYMDQDFNDCCHFSFPHEMLIEYFSMRGLIECLMSNVEYKQAMLLWLCANPKMRNFLQLTCGYIAYKIRGLPLSDNHLLNDMVFIIRACLILQHEFVQCEQNELTQELLQLPGAIQETFPPNILTHGLTAEQAMKMGGISDQIQAMFTENADQLKEAGWFINVWGELEFDSFGLVTDLSRFHEFLLGCLQQLTLQQLEDVFSQTINQLLPCSYFRSRQSMYYVTVVPVGGVKWATLVRHKGNYDPGPTVNITLWSLCDLSSVLNTWSHLPGTQQLLQQHQHQVTYNITIDHPARTLCTSLPADQWSEDEWTPGLREILKPRYCTGRIVVNMGDSTSQRPLSGLLSACMKVITPGHGLTGGLFVACGQVPEEEVTEFCTWARDVGLRLWLLGLRVVLRAGRGEEDWKGVDSAIRSMVEVKVGGTGRMGGLDAPTYMTAEGEVLCEDYLPDTWSEGEDSDSESDSDLETNSGAESDTQSE